MPGFKVSGEVSGGCLKTLRSFAGQTAGHPPDTWSKNLIKTMTSGCPVKCPVVSGRVQMSAVCPARVSLGHADRTPAGQPSWKGC